MYNSDALSNVKKFNTASTTIGISNSASCTWSVTFQPSYWIIWGTNSTRNGVAFSYSAGTFNNGSNYLYRIMTNNTVYFVITGQNLGATSVAISSNNAGCFSSTWTYTLFYWT